MSIYAQDALGVGEGNMVLGLIVLCIPPCALLMVAAMAYGCMQHLPWRDALQRLCRFI